MNRAERVYKTPIADPPTLPEETKESSSPSLITVKIAEVVPAFPSVRDRPRKEQTSYGREAQRRVPETIRRRATRDAPPRLASIFPSPYRCRRPGVRRASAGLLP